MIGRIGIQKFQTTIPIRTIRSTLSDLFGSSLVYPRTGTERLSKKVMLNSGHGLAAARAITVPMRTHAPCGPFKGIR